MVDELKRNMPPVLASWLGVHALAFGETPATAALTVRSGNR